MDVIIHGRDDILATSDLSMTYDPRRFNLASAVWHAFGEAMEELAGGDPV